MVVSGVIWRSTALMSIPELQGLVSEILIKCYRKIVIIFADREGMSPDKIYYRVIELLESANCMHIIIIITIIKHIFLVYLGLVADVTYSSLGVGYEIGYAQIKGYKVLCLFHKMPGRGT